MRTECAPRRTRAGKGEIAPQLRPNEAISHGFGSAEGEKGSPGLGSGVEMAQWEEIGVWELGIARERHGLSLCYECDSSEPSSGPRCHVGATFVPPLLLLSEICSDVQLIVY